MRSYVLANNTAHYDAVIAELEARGTPNDPGVRKRSRLSPGRRSLFQGSRQRNDRRLVSLTGFSLVGGPAYNDSTSATKMLGELDVPYVAAHALEFQTIEEWESFGSRDCRRLRRR